jgi:hypothetical protein
MVYMLLQRPQPSRSSNSHQALYQAILHFRLFAAGRVNSILNIVQRLSIIRGQNAVLAP